MRSRCQDRRRSRSWCLRAYGHNCTSTTDSPTVSTSPATGGRAQPFGIKLGTRPVSGGTARCPQLVLDLGLEHLPDLGPGQVGPDLDLLGRLDAAQAVLDEGPDLVMGRGLAGAELHHGGDALAPLLVGQADD